MYEIVQCKNQAEPLTSPAILREIIKIALHHHIDPTLLEDCAVRYNIWCSGGFTEPAAKLIDTWPSGWVETEIQKHFYEVTEEYKKLSNMEWDSVREEVLVELPKKLLPLKTDGIDISAAIRRRLDVYNTFFSGSVVASLEEVEEVLRRMFSQEGIYSIQDEDLSNIVRRLQSFRPESVHNLLVGHTVGLPSELLAEMTPSEIQLFFGKLNDACLGNTRILLDVVLRKAAFLADRGKQEATFKNRNFPLILSQVFSLRTIGRFRRMSIPTTLHSEFASNAEETDSVEAQIEILIKRVWDDMQGILSQDFIKPTEDAVLEKWRSGIAAHSLKGYNDQIEFEQELRQDFVVNRNLVRELIQVLDEFAPEDFMVVLDTKTAFENKEALRRFGHSLEEIERAR